MKTYQNLEEAALMAGVTFLLLAMSFFFGQYIIFLVQKIMDNMPVFPLY